MVAIVATHIQYTNIDTRVKIIKDLIPLMFPLIFVDKLVFQIGFYRYGKRCLIGSV